MKDSVKIILSVTFIFAFGMTCQYMLQQSKTSISFSIEERNKELDYLRELYFAKNYTHYDANTSNIDSAITIQENLIKAMNQANLKSKSNGR
jgi:hypothetical protein